MPDRDSFGDRSRGLEEDYFRKKERELIEKMRQHGSIEAERRQLAESTGIADEGVLNDLQQMGYTRETVALLHLVPLVYVAWAEGVVDSKERSLIMDLARERGITAGSAAHQQLEDWLKRRPNEHFFQKNLRAIRAMLQSLPSDKREVSHRDLVSFCTQIAAASGGILGLGGKTSAAEKEILSRIAAALEQTHQSASREVIGEGSSDS